MPAYVGVASVSLIWRISQPLTPFRVVLFVFIVIGILVGVIGFPELLSIANLSTGEAVILLAIVVFTCTVFFKLATMMDSLKPRRRHAATGFLPVAFASVWVAVAAR